MAITKLLHIGEAGGKNPSASLYRGLMYIANPEKTDGGRLVCGNMCIPTPQDAYKTMLHTKQLWGVRLETKQNLQKIKYELSMIGTNLNQIAHALNGNYYHYPLDAKRAEEAFAELKKVLDRIMETY